MIAEGLCPSMMDNIITCIDCASKIVICYHLPSLNTKKFQLHHEHKNVFILMKILVFL